MPTVPDVAIRPVFSGSFSTVSPEKPKNRGAVQVKYPNPFHHPHRHAPHYWPAPKPGTVRTKPCCPQKRVALSYVTHFAKYPSLPLIIFQVNEKIKKNPIFLHVTGNPSFLYFPYYRVSRQMSTIKPPNLHVFCPCYPSSRSIVP